MAGEKACGQIVDEDLRNALRAMKTYVDVTEEDLAAIYELAQKYARQRLASRVAVKEVMTAGVIAIGPDVEIHEAAERLSNNGISGMPVVDEENRVLGVISEDDLLRLVGVRRGSRFRDILHLGRRESSPPVSDAVVGDIMSAPAVTIGLEEDVRNIASILDERKIKRLPVVDGDGRLVGIISRADIVKIISKLL